MLVNRKSLLSLSLTLAEIYETEKDNDGFLYMIYCSQQAFGGDGEEEVKSEATTAPVLETEEGADASSLSKNDAALTSEDAGATLSTGNDANASSLSSKDGAAPASSASVADALVANASVAPTALAATASAASATSVVTASVASTKHCSVFESVVS